jgi:hypothetical protein
MAKPLTKPPLDPVPDNGIANLFTDREPDTAAGSPAGEIQEQDVWLAKALTAALNPTEVSRLPKPPLWRPRKLGRVELRLKRQCKTEIAVEVSTRSAMLDANRRDQTLASLCPSASEEPASCCCAHPRPKAVGALALDVARLVCPLHDILQYSALIGRDMLPVTVTLTQGPTDSAPAN